MKLTSDNLRAHLARQLLPVYHVCGDEPLLQNEATDAIRERAQAAGYTERARHFIERGGGWDEVRSAAATLSLFAQRRILEIRMPTGKPGTTGAKVLADLLAKPRDDLLVLLVTGRLDRETQGADWVRAAERAGAVVTLAAVDAERLPRWLAERCRQAGFEADPEALELLAARTEGNLLAVQQEIDKLRLLAPAGRLDAATVLASVADSARFDTAQLAPAIASGEARRALRVLEGLRAEGTELPLVLWMVAREVRTLARNRVRRLPFGRLIERAARVDRMLKGQLRGEAWDELALLAAEACGMHPFPMPAARRR